MYSSLSLMSTYTMVSNNSLRYLKLFCQKLGRNDLQSLKTKIKKNHLLDGLHQVLVVDVL